MAEIDWFSKLTRRSDASGGPKQVIYSVISRCWTGRKLEESSLGQKFGFISWCAVEQSHDLNCPSIRTSDILAAAVKWQTGVREMRVILQCVCLCVCVDVSVCVCVCVCVWTVSGIDPHLLLICWHAAGILRAIRMVDEFHVDVFIFYKFLYRYLSAATA